VFTYLNYVRVAGQSYQESVMRKSWSVASVASDWLFSIRSSLAFWNWAQTGWKYPATPAYILSAIAVVVFAAGWVAVIWLSGGFKRPNPCAPRIRSCWMLLAAGVTALVLSFPVYLLLDSARSLWRTQFLSGIGFGLVAAALLGLLSWLPIGRFGRMAVTIAAGSAIVAYGSVSAIQKGGYHRWVWERHRTAVLEVLRIAPDLQPYTVVVLTNVPKNADPFGHDLWFDMALRLVYPGIPVAGIYYYEDGSPAPGDNITAEGKNWLTRDGFGHMFPNTFLSRTLVVRYDASGTGKLVESLPAFVCKGPCDASQYNPAAAIITGPVAPVTARRYFVPER
jgi:hypothetical protein